jgi:hypothetical protein
VPVNVLARLLVAASLCLPLLASAAPAFAQSVGVQLTAAQMVKPADFTAEERDYYRTLGPAAAKSFIATRSYVRVCRQVVEHKLPALRLPNRPAGFNVKYLLPEDPNIINRALGEYIIAKQSPNHAVTVRPELTAAQILKPAQLTAEELSYYKTLTEPAKKNFILTRSYMRLAQKVADHKMSPLQLPNQPLGFSPDYLLPGEDAVNNKAIGELVAVGLKRKLQKPR